MVDLPRSSAIKVTCESHIRASLEHTSMSTQAAIESVLARHTASVIYAEAEAIIRNLVAQRVAHGTADSRVESFSQVASQRLIRSIKISELSGVLNHFSPACKEFFAQTLTSKQQTDWESLINSRHDTAHENAGSVEHLTLADIDGYFASIPAVLDAFSASLNR